MASFLHKPEWRLQRPATVTLEQVAYELQISVRTARRRVQDGSIPASKVGLFWRVPVSYLDELRSGTNITNSPDGLNISRGPHDPQTPVPAGHAYKN